MFMHIEQHHSIVVTKNFQNIPQSTNFLKFLATTLDSIRIITRVTNEKKHCNDNKSIEDYQKKYSRMAYVKYVEDSRYVI